MKVEKMVFDSSLISPESGIFFGGGEAYAKEWPLNPKGEPLLHLFTINCDLASKKLPAQLIPESGFISVFSTYSESDYFLDDVTYFGGKAELDGIKAGFTYVSFVSHPEMPLNSPRFAMNKTGVILTQVDLPASDYPMFSFFAESIPNGVVGVTSILDDYHFVCQVYSSNFPAPFTDALGLSDANGYLFLRNINSKQPFDGLFFVQTA